MKILFRLCGKALTLSPEKIIQMRTNAPKTNKYISINTYFDYSMFQ